MIIPKKTRRSLLTLLFPAILALTGCDLMPYIIQAGPTATPTPVPTPVVLPTQTPIPPTPVPSPTATRTAVPTPTAIDLFAALGIPTLDELLARSDDLTEYTFDYKVMAERNGAALISGKAYVKGTRVRQEMFIQGQRAVLMGDSQRLLYYLLFSDQKTAVKLDLAAIGNQAVNPSEAVETLPTTVTLVSGEIMNGEESAVFEVTTPQASYRYWIWIERGLPLRVEVTAPEGRAILDFSNYHFGSQPDMLFELPPGTKIVEAPTQPSLPKTGPSLPTPSRTY